MAGYTPDEERFLIEAGFTAERSFSPEFVQMSREGQEQVVNDVVDDLEQNWVVRMEVSDEDGLVHPVLHRKEE